MKEKLITIKETDDFLYFWETDFEGNSISGYGYRKIKPKPEKDFAERLIDELE